jgi:hypothetical protein
MRRQRVLAAPQDRAAVVTTAIMQILRNAPNKEQARWEIEFLLRDEFADLKREIASSYLPDND